MQRPSARQNGSILGGRKSAGSLPARRALFASASVASKTVVLAQVCVAGVPAIPLCFNRVLAKFIVAGKVLVLARPLA